MTVTVRSILACLSLRRTRRDWTAMGNEAVARRDARAAAARFSRGNVAIQLGNFLTTEDLEKEREKVSRIKLPK